MSQQHTLVTYTCLHYALFPTNKPIDSFNDIFEQYSEPSKAQSDLKTKKVACHLAIPEICSNYECYSITQPEWEFRTSSAVAALENSLRSFRRVFMQLGPVYHGIPMDFRLKLSEDRACALTQKQYGLEKRACKDDPFFKPYVQAYEILRQVQRLLRYSTWTDVLLAEVARKINDCRALVSKVSGYEHEIVFGIQKLHGLYSEKVNEEMEVINAENEKIMGEKQQRQKEADELRLAEAKLRAYQAAKIREEQEEAEQKRIREAAAKKTSVAKRFGLKLFGKRATRTSSPEIVPKMLAGPELPIVQPLSQPFAKKAEIQASVSESKKLGLALNSPTLEEVKARGIQKKALLRSAVLADFLDRMKGFN